nr:hypothetical protein [Tanacetum cinerariifolium]
MVAPTDIQSNMKVLAEVVETTRIIQHKCLAQLRVSLKGGGAFASTVDEATFGYLFNFAVFIAKDSTIGSVSDKVKMEKDTIERTRTRRHKSLL